MIPGHSQQVFTAFPIDSMLEFQLHGDWHKGQVIGHVLLADMAAIRVKPVDETDFPRALDFQTSEINTIDWQQSIVRAVQD